MGALRLEELTWPRVRAEIDAGRDTVLVPFGSTEQHGPHLPLGTDAYLGDALGAAVADRLHAFLVRTIPVGHAPYHGAFAGTLWLREETFLALVHDVVGSLAHHGFGRVVLLPTHGGNFPLVAAAARKLPSLPVGCRVVAVSDLDFVLADVLRRAAQLGISAREGGVHAGEWETSLMLALHPDLVDMQRAEVGYVGDTQAGLRQFGVAVDSVAPNGVFGDPRRATAEHGADYLRLMTDAVVRLVEAQSG